MGMQNAEMEFVTFGARDVIMTSGDTITINGYYDGTENNLSVIFGDSTYTDMNSLRTAFDQSGKTFTSIFNYTDGTDIEEGEDTFSAAFANDASDTDGESKYKAANGKYTYDTLIAKWILDYKQ